MHDEHRPVFHAYRRFFIVCISLLMLIWIWHGRRFDPMPHC